MMATMQKKCAITIFCVLLAVNLSAAFVTTKPIEKEPSKQLSAVVMPRQMDPIDEHITRIERQNEKQTSSQNMADLVMFITADTNDNPTTTQHSNQLGTSNAAVPALNFRELFEALALWHLANERNVYQLQQRKGGDVDINNTNTI